MTEKLLDVSPPMKEPSQQPSAEELERRVSWYARPFARCRADRAGRAAQGVDQDGD